MAWRKNFTEIFTYWRGEVWPPIVQTVSLMSRLIKITFYLIPRLKNDTQMEFNFQKVTTG